jgi:hypothetical protein
VPRAAAVVLEGLDLEVERSVHVAGVQISGVLIFIIF